MRGSAPGERRGGRQKGTPNKRTSALQAAVAKSGMMPLEYMLRVMRNGKADDARRDDMAKAAAPYLHPKLTSIEVGNAGNESFKVEINGKVAKL